MIKKRAGAPLLNIFGGKITTYRKLAEHALEKIDAIMAKKTLPWTAHTALPGGDIAIDEIDTLRSQLSTQLPFLDAFTIRRIVRQYGTQCLHIFASIQSLKDLGQNFGHGVTSHEIDWSIEYEWTHSAEDFLWRRSKMGLRFSTEQVKALDTYIRNKKHKHNN